MEIDDEQFETLVSMAGKQDLIKYQLDGTDIVERIEMSLKGYRATTKNEQGPDGNYYPVIMWVKRAEPVMNDEGINYITDYLNEIINKNTILSDFHEETIEKIARKHGRQISRDLCKFRGEFEINVHRIPSVVKTTTTAIFSTLLRAKNGNERRSLAESRQISEIINSQEAGQKKSWLPSIFPKGDEE